MADRETDHQVDLGQLEQVKRAVMDAYASLPDAFAKRVGFVKIDVDAPTTISTNVVSVLQRS